MVLIHGSGGNGRTFDPVAGHFGWADLWCPSLPGRDGSASIDHASLDHGMAALAAWLGLWLGSAGLSHEGGVWLAGHSLGGGVALQLALQAPASVAGVIMISSGARLKVAPAILEAAAKATDDTPLPIAFAFGPDTDPTVPRTYEALAAGVPAAATLGDWRACDGFDVRARLGELQVPPRNPMHPRSRNGAAPPSEEAPRVPWPGGGGGGGGHRRSAGGPHLRPA